LGEGRERDGMGGRGREGQGRGGEGGKEKGGEGRRERNRSSTFWVKFTPLKVKKGHTPEGV